MKEITELKMICAKIIASIHDLQRESRLDEEVETNEPKN